MKEITSSANSRFKGWLKLLQSSRERRLAGMSLLDGVHLAQAYIENVGIPAELIVSYTGLRNTEIATLAARCDTVLVSDVMFNQLSTLDTPSGVIAVVPTPRASMPDRLVDFVLLEDLQDPGNVGSILRTAAAAGVGHVLLTRGCVHAWSPRVLRAAMGAHFVIEVIEGVDPDDIAGRHDGTLIATAVTAELTLYEVDLRGPVGFLLGNEGAGLSAALAARADKVVSIPMPGKVESLNVAAATAVCLFERVRQISIKNR